MGLGGKHAYGQWVYGCWGTGEGVGEKGGGGNERWVYFHLG